MNEGIRGACRCVGDFRGRIRATMVVSSSLCIWVNDLVLQTLFPISFFNSWLILFFRWCWCGMLYCALICFPRSIRRQMSLINGSWIGRASPLSWLLLCECWPKTFRFLTLAFFPANAWLRFLLETILFSYFLTTQLLFLASPLFFISHYSHSCKVSPWFFWLCPGVKVKPQAAISSSTKTIVKTTSKTTTVKARAEKKVFSLPGQKYDPPEEVWHVLS